MLGGAYAALAFMFAMFAKMAVEAPPDRGGEDIALFCAAVAFAFATVAVWKCWQNGMPGVESAALAFIFTMFAKMAVEAPIDRGGEYVALFCAAVAFAFAAVAVWKCWRMKVNAEIARRMIDGSRPRMHYLRMGKSPASKEEKWSGPWSERWFKKGMRDATNGGINAIEKNRRKLRDRMGKAKSGRRIRIAATKRSSYEAGIRLGARLGYNWRKLDDVFPDTSQGLGYVMSGWVERGIARAEKMSFVLNRNEMRTVGGIRARSRYLRMGKSPASEEENWSESWFENGMCDVANFRDVAIWVHPTANAIVNNRRKLREQVDEAKSGRHIRIAAAERSSYEAGIRLGLRGLQHGYKWRKLDDLSLAISRGEEARRIRQASFRSNNDGKRERPDAGAANDRDLNAATPPAALDEARARQLSFD